MSTNRLRRLTDQLARLSAVAANRWLYFTVLALCAAWPYLRTAGAFNEFRDAQVLWLYEDQARRSVLDFFQFPLWNPDFCGGFPAMGTPQSRFAAPTFLLTLIFGTTRAEPLVLFGMVLLALFGTHRYARSHGASHFGATLGASVFGLMGVFACAPFLGWFGFLGFALLPWVLSALSMREGHAVRESVIIAVSASFIVGFGGTYVAPISLVACVVEVGLLLVQRRRVAWVALSAAALLAIALSSLRLWAVWEELHRGPRLIAGISEMGWAIGGQLFGTWPPFTAETWYLVSIPAVVTAGLALLRRRRWWYLAPLVLFLWLSAGHSATPSLFAALRALPVFSLLRNAERFLVAAALTLSLGAALSLDDLRARLRRRVKWAPAVLLVGLLGIALSIPWQLQNFGLAASKRGLNAPPREVDRPFHQARGNRWAAAAWGPMSRGSLACWEAYGLPQSAKLRGDLEHEAWLEESSKGALEETRWSPNRLDFRATLNAPTTLIINQNFHRGWRSSVGTPVNRDGLLAVELPAGTNEVRLRFLPTSAIGGFVVTALALLVIALWVWRPWSAVQRVVMSAVPLVVGLIIGVAFTEPPFTTTQPTGPEGEPLFASSAPPGSTPLKVRFEGGFTMEAASVEYQPEQNRVRIELDWSRAAQVNSRVGVFVHVEPGALKRITADHLQVSDGAFLEQIPLGEVGRDVMLIDVPEAKRGVEWNVWVGLWEMRGDGHRLVIEDSGGQKSADNRVLVGTARVP